MQSFPTTDVYVLTIAQALITHQNQNPIHQMSNGLQLLFGPEKTLLCRDRQNASVIWTSLMC